MADQSSKRSSPERAAAEDPDTAAARKELKQTAISDKQNTLPLPTDSASATATTAANDDKKLGSSTPEPSAARTESEHIKEQISSPKKKRAHDEVDEHNDQSQTANGDVSPLAGSDDRSDRSEPEKKRPRDVSSEVKALSSEATVATSSDKNEPSKSTEADKQKSTQTTASAFSSSGLSAFATSASPFAASGSKPLSSFSSGTSSSSPFKTMGASSSSVFGGGALSSGTSPFGQAGAASKPFGSGSLGSGFGSALGGSKLTSFGKAGDAFKSSKPAKAFGAPESDAESDAEEGADDETEETKEGGEEKESEEDDKKKAKLQRVAVDDGETSEATILSVRAKIYHLDKANKAWKERGAGNLKINVPLQCVDIDEDTGGPIPGSFDASSLEEGDSKMVRLVMRQDSTHKVILNTAVFPAMEFKEKEGLKAVTILFTALEGNNEAVSIQLKMSSINAKAFLNEIGKVQRELQSV